MRSRLFSVLLIPALTVIVLAWLTVASSNTQVRQATVATSNAELYRAVADLDHAIGVEAVRSAELYQTKEEWQEAKWGMYADTDAALAQLVETLDVNAIGHPTEEIAVAKVRDTLDYRADIQAGILSPHQIIELYSRARRHVLDGLQEVSLRDQVNDPDLIGILALVEARSAHLNERLALDLAITYDQWAPGQHSAAVRAISSHDTHLRLAASYQDLGDLELGAEYEAIREQVEVTSETPSVTNEEWRQLSDQWLGALNSQIATSIDQTTQRLEDSQRQASSNRLTLVLAVSAILLFTMVMTSWVAYRLIWRVEAITDQASLLARGLRSTSAARVVGGKDEITSLAFAFDDMADELSKRASAQRIESAALEAIAEGQQIDETLSVISGLLGKDNQGRPLYCFVNEEPGPTIPSINNPVNHQTPLWIVKTQPDAPNLDVTSDQTRTAIGLAAMAQRRSDDDALLEGQAMFDPLTGILNRRKILAIANEAVARSSSHGTVPSLIYVDLDDFKRLNDTYGHSAGDKILCVTARILTELTAPIGASAGRMGGDEFIIVWPDTHSVEELQEFTTEAVTAISKLDEIDGERLPVGVSIGAVRSRRGASLEQLLSEADTALYAAKQAGRGIAVVSDSELRKLTLEETELKAKVLVGLERREFTTWYQPIWNQRGTAVCAIEALARWNHPDGTVKAPSSFLPVLEDQHMLAELDRLVFDHVCQDISSWTSRGGVVVPVHVNVSSMRLEQRGFVEQTMATLARTAVHPEQVVIEVTESGLMTDIRSNDARLQQLRDVGILVATDDFGQGYSSLSYLRDLTVDILKIDRQFVGSIDSHPTNQSIVAAIIRLARSLDLSVVAEGVERAEEFRWLVDAGCEMFQGFLLGHPVPAAEIRALLGTKRDPRLAGPNQEVPAIAEPSLDPNRLVQEADL